MIACLARAKLRPKRDVSPQNLAHEAQVLQQGLTHLGGVLSTLEPLHRPLDSPGGSVLLEELLGSLPPAPPTAAAAAPAPSATAPPTGSPSSGGAATTTTAAPALPAAATAEGGEGSGQSPLLHAMAATHAYIIMFVHVCRTGQVRILEFCVPLARARDCSDQPVLLRLLPPPQSEIRSISMSHWGSELGLSVLRGLSRLYTSLVWESTVLLALCNDSALPPGCPFGRHQLQRLQGTLQVGSRKVAHLGLPEALSILLPPSRFAGSIAAIVSGNSKVRLRVFTKV